MTDFAERVNADLIVVGTQGGSALAHVVFGSVAELTQLCSAPRLLSGRNQELYEVDRLGVSTLSSTASQRSMARNVGTLLVNPHWTHVG